MKKRKTKKRRTQRRRHLHSNRIYSRKKKISVSTKSIYNKKAKIKFTITKTTYNLKRKIKLKNSGYGQPLSKITNDLLGRRKFRKGKYIIRLLIDSKRRGKIARIPSKTLRSKKKTIQGFSLGRIELTTKKQFDRHTIQTINKFKKQMSQYIGKGFVTSTSLQGISIERVKNETKSSIRKNKKSKNRKK